MLHKHQLVLVLISLILISLCFFGFALLNHHGPVEQFQDFNEFSKLINEKRVFEIKKTTADLTAFNKMDIDSSGILYSKEDMQKKDPEMYMNASELIRSKGYPCEIHHVQTEDGFILGMQRIPQPSKGRQPVLLMHGLLSSSDCFLTNLVNESLAYILYQSGFDVWLGNVRGNTYSKSHVKLDSNNVKFWKWSFDEMGKYDIPVMVDYVLKQTGHSKLNYIGHSQGTTTFFSAAIIHGEKFSDKINQFVALGPAEIITHMTSPLHYLSYISKDIANFYYLFGEGEFLPRQGFLEKISDLVCPTTPKLCENLLFLFGGSDLTNTNRSRVPVYTAHNPAGTSVQNMLHWAQMYKSKTMVFYDYGHYLINWYHYGSFTPPSYNLKSFKINSYIFCGSHDTLVALEDCQHLLSLLPNVNEAFIIPTYNHLDFIWAVNAEKMVYNDVIKVLLSK